MKKFYFIIGVLSFLIQHPISAHPFLGYGSSNAVTPTKTQEFFFRGFETGFEKVKGPGTLAQAVQVDQVSDGQMLGAAASTHRLLDQGVVAIFGFPTSHEALLAAAVAKKRGVLMFSAGASHSQLAEMGPDVYTTGESMHLSVEAMLAFILAHHPGKKGAFIINPFAVFSKDQEAVFLDLKRQPRYAGIQMEIFHLDANRRLAKASIARLKKEHFDFLCLTPYADELTELMGQFENEGIDWPILTNSSWLTGDYEAIRRFLTRKKAPIYSGSTWLKGSVPSAPIEAILRRKYGTEMNSEMAYGYDIGIIAATLLQRLNGAPTVEGIKAAMKQDLCFDGTTTGRLCFPAGGGHAHRSIFFVRLCKSGIIPVTAGQTFFDGEGH